MTSAPLNHTVIGHPRATSAFGPALLISLGVHAALGGMSFQTPQRKVIEPAPPLTVKLDVMPPAIIEAPAPPPPQPRLKPPKPAPQTRAVAPPVPHVPTPTLIAVEQTNAVAPAVAPPATEAPPAPVAVAKAPATSAPRAETIEPPHFNVAYLNNPRPAYPPIARKLGLEGVVLLRVDVSAKGTPDKVVVAQTSGASLLDDAAMKAVQGWTFVPARRGDAAIAHPVEVPIRFQLRN